MCPATTPVGAFWGHRETRPLIWMPLPTPASLIGWPQM
jgi:hypothetical protein